MEVSIAYRYPARFARMVNDQNARQIRLRGEALPGQVWLRRQDWPMFLEQFLYQVYRLPEPLSGVAVVVDAGAHIGLASLYLSKNFFPHARFVLIEPSVYNRAILERNLAANDLHADVAAGALGPVAGVGMVTKAIGYNIQVQQEQRKGDHEQVPVWNMADLMEKYQFKTISLLKMDVEGAEQSILAHHNHWLHHTEALLLEVHPPFSFAQLQELLEPFGFRVQVTRHPAVAYATRLPGGNSL